MLAGVCRCSQSRQLLLVDLQQIGSVTQVYLALYGVLYLTHGCLREATVRVQINLPLINVVLGDLEASNGTTLVDLLVTEQNHLLVGEARLELEVYVALLLQQLLLELPLARELFVDLPVLFAPRLRALRIRRILLLFDLAVELRLDVRTHLAERPLFQKLLRHIRLLFLFGRRRLLLLTLRHRHRHGHLGVYFWVAEAAQLQLQLAGARPHEGLVWEVVDSLRLWQR